MPKFLRITIVVVIVAVIGSAVGFLVAPKSPPSKAFPNPNGYDDFLKAAKASVSAPTDLSQASDAELREFLAKGEESLRLARAGMKKECAVPIDFDPRSPATMTNRMEVLGRVKSIGSLFLAESRLAIRSNNAAPAFRSRLELIRFGQDVARGGLMIDDLVGIALGGMAMRDLGTIKDKLSAVECREMAGALEVINARTEPKEDVIKREHEWSEHWGGMQIWFLRRLKPSITAASESKYAQKHQAAEEARRRLMIDLASQAYEIEKKEPPKRPEDLVPEYLKAVPLGNKKSR